MSLWILAAALLFALALDFLFKEPKRFHPLVGFGNWANWIEKAFRLLNIDSSNQRVTLLGSLAWGVTVGFPLILICLLLSLFDGLYLGVFGSVIADQSSISIWYALPAGVILYLAIGWRSLLSHAKKIALPLEVYESLGDQKELECAREQVGRIVSRQTSDLSSEEVASAATESVLENGADGVFAAIFWFALLGVPGVILYRLSNTLDAMWGYKNEAYLEFGRCAAKVDDVLNFAPARLSALSYALVGNFSTALQAWKAQAPTWKSPNAGPVMAAGAGALSVRLGGPAQYDGQIDERPVLGIENGEPASSKTILEACNLINRALVIWVVSICLLLGLVSG